MLMLSRSVCDFVDGTVNQLRQVFDMVVRSKAESANK